MAENSYPYKNVRGDSWCDMNQKNKPQGNALVVGIMMMFISGMHVGNGIFNPSCWYQNWTANLSDGFIMLVISSWNLAAIIGAVFGSLIVDSWSKKKIYVVTLVLYGIGSVVQVVLSQNVATVIVTKVTAGLGHGLVYLAVFIHGGEVVIKINRGMIISTVSYMFFSGVLTGAAFNSITATPSTATEALDTNQYCGIISIIYIIISAIFLPLMCYESPLFLIRAARDAEAIRVMMKLRNEKVETWEIRNDYNEFKMMLEEEKTENKNIFTNRNIRPIMLIIMTKFIYVLSFNKLLNNIRLTLTHAVFSDDNMMVVLFMSFRILFGMISLFTVDKFGRKIHLTTSTVGCGISLLLLSIISISVGDSDRYVAVVFFVLFEISASVGTAAVPDILTSEAFSTTKKAKSIAFVHTVENVMQIVFIALPSAYFFGYVLVIGLMMLLTLAALLHLRLPETAQISLRQTRDAFKK